MTEFLSRAAKLESQRRVRMVRWSEFLQHQTNGDFWILLDGAIYDISNWILPQGDGGAIPHPGGDVPLCCRNKDATYEFEIGHTTNGSYMLLRRFFLGRLDPQDLSLVPPTAGTPSPEFLKHLRSFTSAWLG
eukprot:NODE_4820_length_757_cov_21.683616_g4468_i0.p2 GENE.NODE_4820_length_757_cov_21.683616_g4468_i0~~NODE_4820_length_757_cov_21.683616_g4468_i0.p2  ORF type:complete len:154 (+),score=33.66 NODE_4820_length_757_cov_21.683616_g4468_i0:68-463(+)